MVVTANDEIRLIDFSFAKDVDSNEQDEEITGTPLYMAPEAILGQNDKESDMWSLGVLLYTLVSGTFPFYEKKKYELFNQIKECNWEFKMPAFARITAECKDLISKLLVKNPSDRLTGS